MPIKYSFNNKVFDSIPEVNQELDSIVQQLADITVQKNISLIDNIVPIKTGALRNDIKNNFTPIILGNNIHINIMSTLHYAMAVNKSNTTGMTNFFEILRDNTLETLTIVAEQMKGI